MDCGTLHQTQRPASPTPSPPPELALAGVASAIPADEVIIAMKRIGDAMPAALRETSEGGLAATPTGRRLAAELFGL